jgi:hypothetical protein
MWIHEHQNQPNVTWDSQIFFVNLQIFGITKVIYSEAWRGFFCTQAGSGTDYFDQ